MGRHGLLDALDGRTVAGGRDDVGEDVAGQRDRMSSPFSEAKAARRMSAPSSSRTFDLMWVASKDATSSERSMASASAFFLRIAARVSNSGVSMCTRMPHSNLEQSRSSSPFNSFGVRSLESTICTFCS
jgi:hypothetical protein